MTDIAAIARGLTGAQKAYLTTKAEWRSATGYSPPEWMTFPPPGTHRVLCRLGLTNEIGEILRFGLAVRNYLEGQGDTPSADR